MQWEEVLRRFDDSSAHDAFINECSRARRLDHAAECYRAYLERHPEDPVARARQKQIATRALFELNWRRLSPSGANWSFKSRHSRAKSLKYGVNGTLLGYLVGNLFGLWVLPPGAFPSCDGMLRGSPMCLIVDGANAMQLGFPYAVAGALGGLAVAVLLLRRSAEG